MQQTTCGNHWAFAYDDELLTSTPFQIFLETGKQLLLMHPAHPLTGSFVAVEHLCHMLSLKGYRKCTVKKQKESKVQGIAFEIVAPHWRGTD